MLEVTSCFGQKLCSPLPQRLIIIIIIIIMIFINYKWVDTRWQWSFHILHMHGLWRLITLGLVEEGYMRSM
jgi:hypothetical protein